MIGFTNGCFDLFHAGHRHFLTECRRHCDYLVVAVNSDDYCRRVKGAERPFEPLKQRMLQVRSLAEAVFPFEGREQNLIMEIRPDIVFKGGDHGKEVAVAARLPYWKYRETGDHFWVAKVVRIDRLPGLSTTLEALKRGLIDEGTVHARQTDAGDRPQRQP